MKESTKKKIKSIIKKCMEVVIGLLIVTVMVFLFCGTILFFRKMCFLDSIDMSKEISTQIASLTLSNCRYVLQFVAWVVSLGSIILTIFAFLGFKEYLSFRKLKKEYKKQQNDFSKKFEIIKAKIFYSQKLYDEAWEALSDLQEDGYEKILYQGLTAVKRGDFLDGINRLEKSKDYPEADLARIYYNIAYTYFRVNDFKKSKANFLKAISHRESYVGAIIGLAMIQIRLGEIKEAIEQLEDVLKIDPKNDMVYYNLACYYSLTKNYSKAIESLKKAIDIKPKMNIREARVDSDFDGLRKDRCFGKQFEDALVMKK